MSQFLKSSKAKFFVAVNEVVAENLLVSAHQNFINC